MKETLPMTAPVAEAPPVDYVDDELPPVQPAKRKSFANGVASNVKQHAVILSDISGSMAGAKIDESNAARQGFIVALADPANKDGFIVSPIDFCETAQRLAFAQPATALRLAPSGPAGGTNFEAALNEALTTVTEFSLRPNPEGWHYLRPVVIFMSDGQAKASKATISALHEVADVIAIAFGEDAHQATLGKIASDGQVHVVGADGNELRQFLAQVGETLSQSIQTVRI